MAPARFLLPATLDLTAAAPLARELAAHRGQPLLIDASGVRRLGGLCLQVLLSARASWDADRLAFGVIDPSADFSAALGVFGADILLRVAEPA
jgi:chemotaxis protein CheX